MLHKASTGNWARAWDSSNLLAIITRLVSLRCTNAMRRGSHKALGKTVQYSVPKKPGPRRCPGFTHGSNTPSFRYFGDYLLALESGYRTVNRSVKFPHFSLLPLEEFVLLLPWVSERLMKEYHSTLAPIMTHCYGVEDPSGVSPANLLRSYFY